MRAYLFHIYLGNSGIRPDFRVEDANDASKVWDNTMPSRQDPGDTLTFIAHTSELATPPQKTHVYTRPLRDEPADAGLLSPFAPQDTFDIPLNWNLMVGAPPSWRSQVLTFGVRQGRWTFTVVGEFPNPFGSMTPWIIDPETQVGTGDGIK